MNVLMATSSYPRFPGDVVAPFIESIATGIARRGHRVDVVLPHHPELRRVSGAGVTFHPYRYAPDRWSRWGYAQSLEADHRLVSGLLNSVGVALEPHTAGWPDAAPGLRSAPREEAS